MSPLSLSLKSNTHKRGIIIGISVFLLCLGTGFFSGVIFRKSEKDSFAASASITVVDKGYVLTAKLSETTMPGATATIYSNSPASIRCTQTNPCPVATDKPISILYPLHNDNATSASGETTTLNIAMTIPANTNMGSYTLDIEYQEQPVIPIQDVDAITCTTARSIAYDARNSEIYYIQAIPNSGENNKDLCWMESNLRYAGDGNYDSNWGYADDRYATTSSLATSTANPNDDTRPLTTVSGTAPSTYADAQIANPNGSTDYTNTNAGTAGDSYTYGFYGYLYNWCSAMGGQTNPCNNTSTTGFDTATSICPAGWRLPTAGYYVPEEGDFGLMTNAIEATNDATGSTNLRNNFLAVYSGRYDNGLYSQGMYGYYWSSAPDIYAPDFALHLNFGASSVFTGNNYRSNGYAVRCVKDITPLKDNMNMQDVTSGMCAATPLGATVTLKDQRDSKYYRIRKMADNRCWMIDNLAYDINSAPATGKPAYNPSAQLVSGTTTTVNTRAQYAQNNNIANQGQIPNNGNPTPSYLYNWCAAMGDTSTNCSTTVAYTAGQPTTTQVGICPAPFRLPTVGSTPTPSTQGNGTNQSTASATTTNEFAKLDIWLGGTGTNRNSANTYPNFTTDNTVNPQLFFSGVLSGSYNSGLNSQGMNGYWWSSTAYSGTSGYYLNVNSGSTSVSPSYNGSKNYGFAVRCIL